MESPQDFSGPLEDPQRILSEPAQHRIAQQRPLDHWLDLLHHVRSVPTNQCPEEIRALDRSPSTFSFDGDEELMEFLHRHFELLLGSWPWPKDRPDLRRKLRFRIGCIATWLQRQEGNGGPSSPEVG